MNVVVIAPVILGEKTLMKSTLIYFTVYISKSVALPSNQLLHVSVSLNIFSGSTFFMQSEHIDTRSCSLSVTTKDVSFMSLSFDLSLNNNVNNFKLSRPSLMFVTKFCFFVF